MYFVVYPQVVYFGDSLCSDSFPASTYAGWDVVLVLEEMEAEGYHPTVRDLPTEGGGGTTQEKAKEKCKSSVVFEYLLVYFEHGNAVNPEFLCPRHKMARGHFKSVCFVCPSVPSKFVFSTLPTSLHKFELNLVQMLYHKSRSACGEIIHVLQILAELWPLTLRIFTHFSLSSQLLLHRCMDLNETWQGGCTTSLEVHVER